MKIVYRAHAIERMIERKLRPEEVEMVVLFADGSIVQSHDKLIYYKKLRGRKDNLIAAVVVNANDQIDVITVLVHFEVSHGR